MIYEYNPKIVNRSDDFFDKRNFVGYILPDGKVFECVEHNVSNVCSFLKLYIDLLNSNYENKKEILNVETDNELAKIVLNKLNKMSYDEIHALLEFINNNAIILSDLFVSYFGCHLVTRMKKEIITSELNHECFYNYLLHNFKIMTIPKIMYDEEKKEYHFIEGQSRNEYLYDEIKRIQNEVKENEIELFHKTR